MSLGLIHIFTDPSRFGQLPDPPERECDQEDHEVDECRYCANEQECRELWEKYGDTET